MKKLYLFNLMSFWCSVSIAQVSPDTIRTLEEVIVKAYEQNRRIQLVAAPVMVVNQLQLNRFNNTNILPALNMSPGIRMEERSPGSYRLNIRGSSLRSPFGVRNVKVYFNDIPYTDPGGNTYLNQLGFYNFQSIEIVKGPGSSVYGAGTGGVMLINSEGNRQLGTGYGENIKSIVDSRGLDLHYTAGSFGLHNFNTRIIAGSEKLMHHINFQHQVSQGYRDHSEMRRDALAWHTSIQNKKGVIRTHLLLGDLFYETPGALTKAEYDADPKGSRPAVGGFPSAAAAKAAIFQKMALGGIVMERRLSNHWQNKTTLYGVYSQLKNPTFRNYGHATEPHTGSRTSFSYKGSAGKSNITWTTGGEWQKSFVKFLSYTNANGNADTPISNDKINNTQYFIFTQLDLAFPGNWIVTTGISLNKIKLRVRRNFPGDPTVYERKFSNELAPRFALLKEVVKNISVYTSIARGFSPPTIAEVLPSSNVINTELEAEDGINYEVGAKGNLMQGRLSIDINAFYFRLKNTIVQRRDASGGDFFINAGSTSQKGIETQLKYDVPVNNSFLSTARFSVAHTWHDFKYKDFMQVTFDFSGKELPSVAPHTVVLSADFLASKGIYLNLNYSFTDKIALNDANSEYAGAYNIVDARLGYKWQLKKHLIEMFAGVNNGLDERYSLGNDINGFGGRYYNAAAGRNWFGGVVVGFGR